MRLSQRLHQALTVCMVASGARAGHHPDCGHGLWLNGYTNQPGERHSCYLPGCDGAGQPCSVRCRTVRSALKLMEVATA